LDDELLEAAAVAGLSPMRRFVRITVPMVAPGVALGLLLAFLFGLREVDALVFTRMGGETLPVQLYNMIHYGFDVQVGALSLLWVGGVGLFLLAVVVLCGTRFRLLP
jgi:ABC-type spermidine/putrescine transport system permease subunit II